MSKSLDDPRTFAIIGAAMEVHRALGCGFAESVYQESLDLEFTLRGIPAQRECELPVYYKDNRLKTHFVCDFMCFAEIVVELKALRQLTGYERSQILNYLKASRMPVGLLLNFGVASLQFERLVHGDDWTMADTPP